ncbi:hypothetical protein [Methylobacterium sp. Leaf89]|uniref:hypothetical protein n=1 Tax=Methylobacterium sp. Leaf89 TaxID=1736245 RepID=UPI000B01A1DD|nr:hypothetical protein [Methylobacterium sp. Leaf89]
MSDSNNPAEGTASLSLHDAASQITALFGNDDAADAVNEAVEAEVPSHEDADATEVHPEADTDEAEHTEEDAEPEETEAHAISEDAEVEVNGERVKVKDLKSGYLRQSDYTRKTQELAQQRQHAESQIRSEYNAQATQYLSQVEQNLRDHFPQEPNWVQLAEDNPAQYAVEREQWNKRLSDLTAVRQLRAQHEQAAQANKQAAIAQAQAEAYTNLVQLHPEFARTNDGKVSPASAELVNFAVNEVGLPEELLQGVTDARLFSIMYDAMRFRKMKAQEGKTIQSVASKPPLAKPGVTTGKATVAHAEHAKQMSRLKRTGSVEDAASIISRLL